MAIKEKGYLFEGITKIINELLTTFVYAIILQLTEKGAVIFIETLLQKTNRFQWAFTSSKIETLVLVYTKVLNKEDLKEPKGISKFTKVSGWIHPISPEKSNIIKTLNSRTSS